MSAYDFEPEPDTYWESERVNDRDEYDQHVRAVDETERDRLERDVGESGVKGQAA